MFIYMVLTPFGDALSIIAKDDYECATMIVKGGYCDMSVAIDIIDIGKKYLLGNEEKSNIEAAYLGLKSSNIQVIPYR